MEKYLRLLNPKTTNFDSVGGGSHGALTAQDVCTAISYAGLTELQSTLLNLLLVKPSVEQLHDVASKISKIYDWEKENKAVFCALVESFACPAKYKPSERNRALITGESRMQIQRHLNVEINNFNKLFKDELKIIESKIFAQF